MVNKLLDSKISTTDFERLKRREILAQVFRITQAYCKGNNKNRLKTKKITDWGGGNYSDLPVKDTIISVVNKDCVEVAKEFSKKGKTCMINMANASHKGGGVERGAMAQEEELCRRSNLWYGLLPSYYPMNDTQFIYSKNVKFFRDKNYQFEDEFKCDIITIAAPCLIGFKPHKFPKNYKKIVEKKIIDMISYPATIGVKHLILSAFGCGAFRNNPRFISMMFKKHLKNLPYETVTFAILDTSTLKTNNFEIFRTILR